MIEDLEVKVTREIVFEESTDHLDSLKTDMFATKEEKETSEYQYTTDIDNGEVYLEATEVEISVMRKLLDKAEKAGGNFVSIDFHGDHGEYDVYGLKLERASVEVVDADIEEERIAKEGKRQQKISELEAELKELKK